jgi:hypothetical protein
VFPVALDPDQERRGAVPERGVLLAGAGEGTGELPQIDVADAATSDGKMRQKLAEAADEILHDAACAAAFNAMTPGEKADTDGQPTAFDALLTDPTSDAAKEYVERTVAGAVAPEVLAAVAWGQYLSGVAEKAQNFASGLDGNDQVDVPRGAQSPTARVQTRAWVYYARECLQPPH